MIAFSIFSLNIYRYGIFYFVWFISAYRFFRYIWKQWFFKTYKWLQQLLTKWLDDLFLVFILWVMIWWRLAEVIIYNPKYYLINPIKIFYIQEWWMGFVGGVIGVFLWMLFIKKSYKLTWKEFLLLWDLSLTIAPIWILFGRIWNFLNQELYGKTIENLFWNIGDNANLFFEKIYIFHRYSQVDNQLRLNTNILESLGEWLIIFVINIVILTKKYIKWLFKPGLITWIFFIFYWIYRFFIEFLRDLPDYEYLWILTKSQYLMFIFIILGIFILYQSQKNKTIKS
jgi:phosphatidylglycerol:prolipoprotein diacylglycerol transferase